MSSQKTALITGASSGIGYELAHIFTRNGYSVVAVARDSTKLDGLKKSLEEKYKVAITTIVSDLSIPGAAEKLFADTAGRNIIVDVLVNNAGFGTYGFFTGTDLAKELAMIELNCSALTALCKLYGREMVARKSGKILNVASTAAFQPSPIMAVYFASKAYVLSLSEALANEFADAGVTVTALCPGPTATGFQKAAKMAENPLFSSKIPTARAVAEFGYRAMLRGQVVAIHGLKNRLLAFLVRLTPRKLVVKIMRRLQM